ncbi:MAG: hypothetical protein ACPGXL_10390, partial [Chitinophagales bacterium]
MKNVFSVLTLVLVLFVAGNVQAQCSKTAAKQCTKSATKTAEAAPTTQMQAVKVAGVAQDAPAKKV